MVGSLECINKFRHRFLRLIVVDHMSKESQTKVPSGVCSEIALLAICPPLLQANATTENKASRKVVFFTLVP